MSLAVNDSGFTFTAWHEQAGYTISWMARCDMRFFAMLHKAWREGDSTEEWKGHPERSLYEGDNVWHD